MQEIIVALMQHRVVFSTDKLAVTFESEAKPQLFLACS